MRFARQALSFCRSGFSRDLVDTFAKKQGSRLKPLLQGSLLLAAVTVVGCSSLTKKGAGAPTPSQPEKPAPSATTPPLAAPVPDKGDVQARFNAALQMMREKKLPEAEAAFVALDQDFPKNSGTLTNLGIIYAKSNRLNQALTALDKATDLNDRNAVAWNWLGITERQSGDRAKAERAYLKAISAKPDYALPHLNLGILYDTYLSHPADALEQYRQYQKLAGKEDLRVTAWIAELESKPAKPAAASATPAPASPTAPATKEPSDSFLPVHKK